MRNLAPERHVVIALLASSLAAVSSGLAGAVPDGSGRLSVRETLTAVVARSKESMPWNLYRNANPNAKAALYDLLGNREAEPHHQSALLILGYITDGSDVPRLESLVRDTRGVRGVMSTGQADRLCAVFSCLGLMAGRGIVEASEALERMMSPGYWRNSSFRWYSDNDFQIAHGTVYETISRVMEGYALGGDADGLRAATERVLEGIQDPKTRKYVEWRIGPARLAGRAQRVRTAEQQPVSQKDRDGLAYVWGRNAAVFAKKSELSEAAQAFVRGTTGEARNEFEQIKLQVIKGDFKALASRLLDNGRVVDQEKAKRQWAEFTKALQQEQQVFESLADIKSAPGDYKVDREVSYEFPSLDDEGAAVGVAKTETVTVCFKLNGSSEIGNVLFRRLRGSRTVASDGTLIVLMKKIDGKWYWNPFGW